MACEAYNENAIYIAQLIEEKESLHPSCVHAARLLAQEIDRVQTGTNNKDKKLELHNDRPISLVAKVRLPVREYPQINFPGRIIGPKGVIMRHFQEKTGTKLSVFGRGSMSDKAKEEEFRQMGGKYSHLNDELHVHLEAFGEAADCYYRMSVALNDLKGYLGPEDPGTMSQLNGCASYPAAARQPNHATIRPSNPTSIGQPNFATTRQSNPSTVRISNFALGGQPNSAAARQRNPAAIRQPNAAALRSPISSIRPSYTATIRSSNPAATGLRPQFGRGVRPTAAATTVGGQRGTSTPSGAGRGVKPLMAVKATSKTTAQPNSIPFTEFDTSLRYVTESVDTGLHYDESLQNQDSLQHDDSQQYYQGEELVGGGGGGGGGGSVEWTGAEERVIALGKNRTTRGGSATSSVQRSHPYLNNSSNNSRVYRNNQF